MERLKMSLLLTVVVMLCTACATPAPTAQPAVVAQAGPVAWIDAPLNGSNLPLAPYEIVVHCNVPSGVAWVELTVDGDVLLSSAPSDTAQSLVTVRQVWNPLAPGNYTLRVRTQDRSGVWGEYASATVTVGGETSTPTPVPPPPETAVPSDTPTPLATATPVPTLTPIPTPIPTLTPIPTPVPTFTPLPVPTSIPTSIPTAVPTLPPPPPPQVPVLSDVYVSSLVFYSDGKCGVTHVDLRVLADDPGGVTGVTLYYRLQDKADSTATAWTAEPMTRVVWEPETHARWLEQLNAGEELAGIAPGREYTLQYYFFATNALGFTAQTPVYQDVTFNTRACVH
jgi:hypothetical protein